MNLRSFTIGLHAANAAWGLAASVRLDSSLLAVLGGLSIALAWFNWSELQREQQ